MLSLRFLAMPAVALAVIVALAHAHPGAPAAKTPAVERAVNCALASAKFSPACALANDAGAVIVR